MTKIIIDPKNVNEEDIIRTETLTYIIELNNGQKFETDIEVSYQSALFGFSEKPTKASVAAMTKKLGSIAKEFGSIYSIT